MPEHPSSSVPHPETIRRIVAEVVRRVRGESAAGSLQPSGAPSASRRIPSADVTISGRVLSLAMLEKLPAGTHRITVEASAVITPSARDHAREQGIVIERAVAGMPEEARGPFLVAHAECGSDAADRAGAIARGVPGGSQLPATGLADVVAAMALQVSRDAARGVLLTGRPAIAAVLANRQPSLRAVTARDPATLAAMAAECHANLLVVDPGLFPAAALLRLANELAKRPTGETPAVLAAASAGCGCQGH
jgi:hypothetical protein